MGDSDAALRNRPKCRKTTGRTGAHPSTIGKTRPAFAVYNQSARNRENSRLRDQQTDSAFGHSWDGAYNPAASSSKRAFKASVSANVSYKGQLTEDRLAHALMTGHIPIGCESQISVILDEVPVPVVVKAVEETAQFFETPPKKIWKNLASWSKNLHLYRRIWS